MSTVYWNRRSENKIYYYDIKNSMDKIQWRSTHCRKKSKALLFLKDNQPVEIPDPAMGIHTLTSFYELHVSLKSNLLRHKTKEIHNFP